MRIAGQTYPLDKGIKEINKKEVAITSAKYEIQECTSCLIFAVGLIVYSLHNSVKQFNVSDHTTSRTMSNIIDLLGKNDRVNLCSTATNQGLSHFYDSLLNVYKLLIKVDVRVCYVEKSPNNMV